MSISFVEFKGQSYQVLFDASGNPTAQAARRIEAAEGEMGEDWHRRQGSAGRQSVVVAAILHVVIPNGQVLGCIYLLALTEIAASM